MTRKTFTANSRKEPLEFEVSTGDVFHARPKIPAGVLLRFAAMSDSDDDEGVKVGAMASHVVDFMRKAISRKDLDRFLGMLKLDEKDEQVTEDEDYDEDEACIDLAELIEIATWLAGEYSAGRPTGTTSENGSPVTPTGPDSTVGVSPGVTTYSRPDPMPVGSTT